MRISKLLSPQRRTEQAVLLADALALILWAALFWLGFPAFSGCPSGFGPVWPCVAFRILFVGLASRAAEIGGVFPERIAYDERAARAVSLLLFLPPLHRRAFRWLCA
jgi:hypothetical protein